MTECKNTLTQKDEEGIELSIREKRGQGGRPSKGQLTLVVKELSTSRL